MGREAGEAVRMNIVFSPCRSLTPSWPCSWASCRSPCGSPPGWSWRWGRSRAPPPAPPPPRAPGYPDGPQPLHGKLHIIMLLINKGYYEYINISSPLPSSCWVPPLARLWLWEVEPAMAGCQLSISPITDKIICLNLILPNRTWWLAPFAIRCQGAGQRQERRRASTGTATICSGGTQ